MKRVIVALLLVLPASAQIRYGQEVTKGNLTTQVLKVPNWFFKIAGIPVPTDEDQVQVYAKTTDPSVAAFRVTVKFAGGSVEQQVLPAHRIYYWQAVATFWSKVEPVAVVIEELRPKEGALEL